ncbi:hypothetical protein ACHFJ0_04760 [Paracoccus sp. NGMCC 1.201697]|uniref:Uncharacterized protein n=1 Tax=Paracoccus broussonetiae subsp. drimophilus TaxID=3373869 RepID=A0ABW7LGS4_9RHOB
MTTAELIDCWKALKGNLPSDGHIAAQVLIDWAGRLADRLDEQEAEIARLKEVLRPFAIEHAWDGNTRFEIVLASHTGSILGSHLDAARAALATDQKGGETG